MNSKEKIEAVLAHLNLKAPTFASNIGVDYQRIFDIQRGKTKKVSGEVANAIINKYPQFEINFFLGENIPMIKEESNSEITTPATSDNELIKELRLTIANQQKTIDRLTEMLYSQNKKADASMGVEVADAM